MKILKEISSFGLNIPKPHLIEIKNIINCYRSTTATNSKKMDCFEEKIDNILLDMEIHKYLYNNCKDIMEKVQEERKKIRIKKELEEASQIHYCHVSGCGETNNLMRCVCGKYVCNEHEVLGYCGWTCHDAFEDGDDD